VHSSAATIDSLQNAHGFSKSQVVTPKQFFISKMLLTTATQGIVKPILALNEPCEI
jgi:hypothetical protein